MAGIGRAPEGSAPVSRLHQRQSFDPADFGVPAGREEEWRFTPLRRLRTKAEVIALQRRSAEHVDWRADVDGVEERDRHLVGHSHTPV